MKKQMKGWLLIMGLGALAASAGGSFLNKAVDYDVARRLQHDSQDFTQEVYQNKHQWEIEDLKKAGLNPILSATGSGGVSSASGTTSTAPMDNISSASALREKVEAETDLAEQQTAESRARELLTTEQTTTASAIAQKEQIDAQRKLREFKAVDEQSFGKNALPIIESLPAPLRGPARFGVGTAGKIKDMIQEGYQTYKKNSTPKPLTQEEIKRNEHNSKVRPTSIKEIFGADAKDMVKNAVKDVNSNKWESYIENGVMKFKKRSNKK